MTQSKKDRIKQQANRISQGKAPSKTNQETNPQLQPSQFQALPGQSNQPQQPQNLALSQEAMGNILAATNQAIAALSQASAPLGYQKGVELSQAMNQFPLAMQQGFQEHQAATMGRFGENLNDFQRDITALLEANAAPVLTASPDGPRFTGDTPKAIAPGPSDTAG